MNTKQFEQVVLAILALVLVSLSPLIAADITTLSPSAIVATSDPDTLIIAESDAKRLAFVTRTSGHIAHHVSLAFAPSGLCLSADQSRLLRLSISRCE